MHGALIAPGIKRLLEVAQRHSGSAAARSAVRCERRFGVTLPIAGQDRPAWQPAVLAVAERG